MEYDESAVVDDDIKEEGHRTLPRSPLSKTRSLSDGGTPGRRLSPSPLIHGAARRTAIDDSSLPDPTAPPAPSPAPVTPRRSDFHRRSLSLQVPPRDASPVAHPPAHARPVPLSPKLDHSQIYASPTNILPRRSRGLDFSRVATSLHHSILAEQSSPDSSPVIGGRAVNIPGRNIGEYATAETSNSLWSIMGSRDRVNISSSLGSGNNMCSDSSETSDEDEIMDDDMDEAYVTTPQITKVGTPLQPSSQGSGGSPAFNSFLSFQQRHRSRKQSKQKRVRGSFGLGFGSIGAATPNNILSKSPPNNILSGREVPGAHSRRESISWAANQLHISGSESDDNLKAQMDGTDGLPTTPSRDGQRGVVRRVVTRRGNLLVI